MKAEDVQHINPEKITLDIVLSWDEQVPQPGTACVFRREDGQLCMHLLAVNHRVQKVQQFIDVHLTGKPEDGPPTRFVLFQIGAGVWKVWPSLVVPGSLHGYLTLINVPEPAPWAPGHLRLAPESMTREELETELLSRRLEMLSVTELLNRDGIPGDYPEGGTRALSTRVALMRDKYIQIAADERCRGAEIRRDLKACETNSERWREDVKRMLCAKGSEGAIAAAERVAGQLAIAKDALRDIDENGDDGEPPENLKPGGKGWSCRRARLALRAMGEETVLRSEELPVNGEETV